jgi:hypothetical protein
MYPRIVPWLIFKRAGYTPRWDLQGRRWVSMWIRRWVSMWIRRWVSMWIRRWVSMWIRRWVFEVGV